jgi:FkbM family methyltransferase
MQSGGERCGRSDGAGLAASERAEFGDPELTQPKIKASMDNARRIIRSVLGPTSPVYQLGAHVLGAAEIARKEGLAMVPRIRRLASAPGGNVEELRLNSLAHPIAVRPGTEDIPTLLDNVIREEYGRYVPRPLPGTMIDAGAFIGDSTAWFLSRYPELRVVALEPEEANHRLAERNLLHYGARVTLFRKALAGHDGSVCFGGASTGAAIGLGTNSVPAVSVPTLLRMLPRGRADILKMDIEGAELEVLGHDAAAWLPAIGMVIAELHGAEITRTVTRVLRVSGFGARSYRSLTYFSRHFA